MEKYGFVYIWYDRKHKRYYIGSHWGSIDDGYICSSTWMRDAYKRRPDDFKRRIIEIIWSSKIDTLLREQHYLSFIKPHEKKTRYYNIQTSVKAYIDSLEKDNRKSVRQKISDTKKKYWDSSESDENRKKISEYNKMNGIIPPSRKGKPSWNKGLTKETDDRVLKNAIAVSKPKKKKPKEELKL